MSTDICTTPAPADRQVLVRDLDRGLAGGGRLRHGGPAADARRARRAQAGRARRLRRELPRQRRVRLRRHRRPSGPSGSRRSGKALDETGLVVTTATTNLFGHPMFKEGGFTANDRDVRRFALAKVMRNLDLAAELGARIYVCWGGRDGAESGAARTCAPRWTGSRRRIDILCGYVLDQGYRPPVRDRAEAERAARRHPAADRRARAGVHQRAGAPRAGRRSTRRSGTRRCPA